jgi:hypothetical protein
MPLREKDGYNVLSGKNTAKSYPSRILDGKSYAAAEDYLNQNSLGHREGRQLVFNVIQSPRLSDVTEQSSDIESINLRKGQSYFVTLKGSPPKTEEMTFNGYDISSGTQQTMIKFIKKDRSRIEKYKSQILSVRSVDEERGGKRKQTFKRRKSKRVTKHRRR